MRRKSPDKSKLFEQLLIGAVAGTVGTLLMTVSMSRLFKLLPEFERYPLPPREIAEAVGGRKQALPERGRATQLSMGESIN